MSEKVTGNANTTMVCHLHSGRKSLQLYTKYTSDFRSFSKVQDQVVCIYAAQFPVVPLSIAKTKISPRILITTPTQKAALGSQFLQGSPPLMGLGTGIPGKEAPCLPQLPGHTPRPPQASSSKAVLPAFTVCSWPMCSSSPWLGLFILSF